MISPTPSHPPTPRDVSYSIGANPTGNLRERIEILEGAVAVLIRNTDLLVRQVDGVRYARTVQKAHRPEMACFCAACQDLRVVILPRCWNLARWCLYHGARLLWKTLTWLCRALTGLLKRRLTPTYRAFSPRGYTTVERIAPRPCRQCRRRYRSSAARRRNRR